MISHASPAYHDKVSIESRVKDVIAEVLQIEQTSIGDQFHADNNPYWDSLAHLRLIEKLESEFSLSIPHEHFESMLDYKSIVELVRSDILGRDRLS